MEEEWFGVLPCLSPLSWVSNSFERSLRSITEIFSEDTFTVDDGNAVRIDNGSMPSEFSKFCRCSIVLWL